MSTAAIAVAMLLAVLAAIFVDRAKQLVCWLRGLISKRDQPLGELERLARKKARKLLRDAIEKEAGDRRG